MSSSCVFPHHFHQFLATAANFPTFGPFCPLIQSLFEKQPELSHTNSDFDVPYIKIDQKKFLDLSVPAADKFDNFRKPKFASKVWFFTSWCFFHIFRNLQKIPQATSFTSLSSKFLWLLFLVLLSKRKIVKKQKELQGFRSCCSEAGLICVSFPPNRELPEPFGRSGHPCSHQVVIKPSHIPLGSHLPLVSSVVVFVP